MTLSIGASASVQGGSGITTVTTSPVTTQVSGSGFVVDVGWYAAVGTPTISDSKSNVYAQVGSTIADAGAPDLQAARFECVNGVGGSGHTWTATWPGAVDGTSFAVEIKTTNGAGIVRDQAPAGNNPSPPAPFTSNAATTTVAAEAALACAVPVAYPGTDLVTWGSGFTALETIGDSDHVTGHTAYRLLSSTGTYAAAYTPDGSGGATTYSALMRLTTYSEAAGGGGGVTSTAAASIESDFSASATASESIPTTVAVSIAGDFTVAAAANTPAQAIPASMPQPRPRVVRTLRGMVVAPPPVVLGTGLLSVGVAGIGAAAAASIDGDLTVAGNVTESIPSSAAASIGGDLAVDGSVVVANPITAAGAADITTDVTVSGAVTETIPGSVAASMTSDLTVAASVSVASPITSTVAPDLTGDLSVAASVTHQASGTSTITNDFTVAAAVAETIPGSGAVDIAADVTASALALVGVQSTAAATIANDFTVSGVATESIPIAVAVNDVALVAAAAVAVSSNASMAAAVDITADVSGAAVIEAGALFKAPTREQAPRVAVVRSQRRIPGARRG